MQTKLKTIRQLRRRTRRISEWCRCRSQWDPCCRAFKVIARSACNDSRLKAFRCRADSWSYSWWTRKRCAEHWRESGMVRTREKDCRERGKTEIGFTLWRVITIPTRPTTDHYCCCQVTTRTYKKQSGSLLCTRHLRQWETVRYINKKQPIQLTAQETSVYRKKLVRDDKTDQFPPSIIPYHIIYTTNNTTCHKLIAHEHCLLSTGSFETRI